MEILSIINHQPSIINHQPSTSKNVCHRNELSYYGSVCKLHGCLFRPLYPRIVIDGVPTGCYYVLVALLSRVSTVLYCTFSLQFRIVTQWIIINIKIGQPAQSMDPNPCIDLKRTNFISITIVSFFWFTVSALASSYCWRAILQSN